MSKRRSAATKRSAERPAWHFFGGKGGVGKTTCAAAWALAHADRGSRVLILSTDPAHSLGDAFARPLGAAARRIPARRGRLDAVEIHSARTVSRWLDARRAMLGAVIERGTLLDRDDVAGLLALPMPGLDELAAFLRLGEFDRTGDYDLLVVDTAPTGHTLRLLETPELIDRLGRALEAMDERDAAVRSALTGHRRVVARAGIVTELGDHARAVAAMLRDRSRCEVRWVTLPEPVAVAETIAGVTWLRERHIALTGIVVNRVTSGRAERCTECTARRDLESAALRPLVRIARDLEMRCVPDQPREPRGAAALRGISEALRQPSSWRSVRPTKTVTRRPRGLSPFSAFAEKGTVPFDRLVVPPSTRVAFFGGKGGVGKTTCAAAAALMIAHAGRPVRLISIDPAPSLGDVLGTTIGDRWHRVAPRLLARELDAERVLNEYKTKYRQAISDMFDRLRGGSIFDAAADRAVFERLFDLAPPGLDEIAALLTVTSLSTAGNGTWELVVVDAAPTGHMLRLLAMPADAQRWVALLMRLLLKYQLTGRAGSLAADLVTLSRELRMLSNLLRDPRQARVVAVTRPAALPRLETSRMLDELRRLNVTTSTLIVNAATAGTCATCRARRRVERREVATLGRLCRPPACTVVHSPLALPPPRGQRDLLAWAGRWTETRKKKHETRNKK